MSISAKITMGIGDDSPTVHSFKDLDKLELAQVQLRAIVEPLQKLNDLAHKRGNAKGSKGSKKVNATMDMVVKQDGKPFCKSHTEWTGLSEDDADKINGLFTGGIKSLEAPVKAKLTKS